MDCIGPFLKSEGKQYVLVRVEVMSELTQAEGVARAAGHSTVKGLKLWLNYLPWSQSLQSHNGSHFTARVVPEWTWVEEIQWIFHSSYYPRASDTAECRNVLLKRTLKPHEPGWARGCQMGYIESTAAGELMGAHNSQPFVFNPHPYSPEQKRPKTLQILSIT